jgi:hypothetical protein
MGQSTVGASRKMEEKIVDALLSFDNRFPSKLVTQDKSVLKQYHASLLQDAWLVLLFEGMRKGFFLDVAAFDAVATSNTLILQPGYD